MKKMARNLHQKITYIKQKPKKATNFSFFLLTNESKTSWTPKEILIIGFFKYKYCHSIVYINIKYLAYLKVS